MQSYAPNFLDSADSQQRLLLYQEVDNMDDLTFGKKKSEKKFKKAKKKANKEGEEFDEEKAREEARAVMIGTMSPSDVIEMDPIRNEEAFINPDRLEEYEFIYEENSSIQGREMIVIRFQSRGKVGSSDIYQRGKQSGRLYFDQATDALASVVIDHEMVIPGALKPILFLMGYSVSNPMIHSQVNYQFFQGRWYPQSTQFHMQIRMVDKHFFSENEESNLDVKMLVVFSDWNVDDAQEIPEDKRMKYSKNMEDQLQPLSHITWDSIHRVPFK